MAIYFSVFSSVHIWCVWLKVKSLPFSLFLRLYVNKRTILSCNSSKLGLSIVCLHTDVSLVDCSYHTGLSIKFDASGVFSSIFHSTIACQFSSIQNHNCSMLTISNSSCPKSTCKEITITIRRLYWFIA